MLERFKGQAAKHEGRAVQRRETSCTRARDKLNHVRDELYKWRSARLFCNQAATSVAAHKAWHGDRPATVQLHERAAGLVLLQSGCRLLFCHKETAKYCGACTCSVPLSIITLRYHHSFYARSILVLCMPCLLLLPLPAMHMCQKGLLSIIPCFPQVATSAGMSITTPCASYACCTSSANVLHVRHDGQEYGSSHPTRIC